MRGLGRPVVVLGAVGDQLRGATHRVPRRHRRAEHQASHHQGRCGETADLQPSDRAITTVSIFSGGATSIELDSQ